MHAYLAILPPGSASWHCRGYIQSQDHGLKVTILPSLPRHVLSPKVPTSGHSRHHRTTQALALLSDCVCCLQVSATGADAFSRRKTQSKVYWSTIPKNKRDELQAAAAAAGTTVQINERWHSCGSDRSHRCALVASAHVDSSLYNFSMQTGTEMLCLMRRCKCTVRHHVCVFRVRKVHVHVFIYTSSFFNRICVYNSMHILSFSAISLSQHTSAAQRNAMPSMYTTDKQDSLQISVSL